MSTNPRDLGLVLRATEFAARKHRNQRRKDKEASPYINHPITLANILLNEGGIDDPKILAAALLHDTVEDTETTYDELKGQFGVLVAYIVMEVTDVKWLNSQVRKRLQVSRASRSTRGAKLVKLADKIANLRDMIAHPPAGWSIERKREYFDWAKSVVDQIRNTNARLEKRFDRVYRQRP